MNIDFDKTKHIVEKCWEIACTASMPGAGEMIQGKDGFSGVRLNLFQNLVQQLIPNNQVVEGNTSATVEVSDKKETWE